MPLKLMYITNIPEVASIAQSAGVDRIFVDMEYIGKEERQGGLDTVKSFHTVDDVIAIKKCLAKSELLVRINPIHHNSKNEIDSVIEHGADIVMLPMAKSSNDVACFLDYVNSRVKTMLLLETSEAVEDLDNILKNNKIDEIHIGLNDLHLSYNKKFMFELLSDGTVEKICKKIQLAKIPYGFGGIARLGYGMLKPELIISEHYRLGSEMAILSRSFCNLDKLKNLNEIEKLFKEEMEKIRDYEKTLQNFTEADFNFNQQQLVNSVDSILKEIGDK